MARAEAESDADADPTDAEHDRCKALTESGSRCSRPAEADGFCYQHDESDPTIDDDGADGEDAATGAEADEATESNATADTDTDDSSAMSETETQAESTDPDDVDTEVDVDPDASGIESVLEIRRVVESTAGQLIGRKLDGVNEISATEDGWRGVVEVVERSAIPDTQDILGRYEIDLTEDGTVEGYRRIDRYRRDDTSDRE